MMHEFQRMEDRIHRLEEQLLNYQSVDIRKDELERYIRILTSIPHDNGTFVREMDKAVKEFHSLMFGDKP